ncbi:lipid droplet assembly factor 1-like [Pempheris klunzingeri]|uniref:lipid droplet assembly factor 1-like n=1 Tax=Pempheris klunzingeri TaxID=3127111 RepID=UPI00397F50D8
MQHSSNNSMTEIQQLWGSLISRLNHLYDDPKVAQLMNTRLGQYLSSHPVLALTVLLFSAMAVLPVGFFLLFALVTVIMMAVGFVFFEAFLLCVGGLTLLCVLSGIAFLSVMVSFIFNVFYITISNILSRYYPHLTKQGQAQRKDSEFEASRQKQMQ